MNDTALRQRHLVLYDGVCGLCNRLNIFILRHDKRGQFQFAAMQSTIGVRMLKAHGKDPDFLQTFFLITDYESQQAKLLSRTQASIFIANALGWPWKSAGLVARLLPLSLLDKCYDYVAQNRYRMFGRYDSCPVPKPEYRERFLDY